jgi:RNA polymerase sigma factor for flagellar operon FliA
MYTPQGKIAAASPTALLKAYAPLVRRLALQLLAKLPACVDLDDLIQVGMMGLLEAGERYQDLQKAKFETYASQRIRGAMLDELRANDFVSRGMRQSAKQVARAIQAQEQQRGRAPSESEIAGELKMPLADYQQLLQDIHGCQLVHVEDVEGPEDSQGFLEQHAAVVSREDDPMAQLMRKGLRQHLIQALQALPEREQLLMSLYYDEELNLREIGAVLEVSQARVCQLHSQAIARLRSLLPEVMRDGRELVAVR